MSHAYHHFLTPTLDPDIRRCSKPACMVVERVVVTRPAPSIVGSATSEEAARRIEGPQRQRTRMLVWQAFLKAGGVRPLLEATMADGKSIALDHWYGGGLTDEEGCTETGLEGSTFRPRRVELVADGLVFDSGATRPTRSGRAAVVWQARPPR